MLFLFLSHPLEAYRMGHAYLYTLAWCGTHGRATHPKMETFSNSHFTENEIKKEKARKAKENRKKREREKKSSFSLLKNVWEMFVCENEFSSFWIRPPPLPFFGPRCRHRRAFALLFLVPIIFLLYPAMSILLFFQFLVYSFCITSCFGVIKITSEVAAAASANHRFTNREQAQKINFRFVFSQPAVLLQMAQIDGCAKTTYNLY